MNRKGIAILTLVLIIGGVMVGGGVAADQVLRSTVGIGLGDALNVLLDSSSYEGLPSLEQVRSELTNETYTNYLSQKESLDSIMNEVWLNRDQLNNNTDAVGVLSDALGVNYRIYLFSYATEGNLSFKVAEYSVEFSNGRLTALQTGESYDSYGVTIQISQDVLEQAFSGQASSEAMIEWVTEKKIKIKPITEIMRVTNALPRIIELAQRHAQGA